jgi:hypothetical protein
MTVTEEARYHLHQQLDDSVGQKGANTMMELLPPVGWADVATKRDLDQQSERLEHKIERVELRLQADIAGVRSNFENSLRHMQTVILSTVISGVGLLSALVIFGPH